jgi:SAM-dependent methyltransferase
LEACPACGKADFEFWCRGQDRLYGLSPQRFTYSRCASCRLLFQSERPTEEAIGFFYPSDYAPYVGQGKKKKKPGLLAELGKRFKTFMTKGSDKLWPMPSAQAVGQVYVPPGEDAVLLDFGCGSADFIGQAAKQGWKTIGMDFSPTAVAQVEAAGHLAIQVEPGCWEHLADASLDAVRMNHVMEHLYHPEAFLTQIRQKMKPGARLHMAMPSSEGISPRVFKSDWYGLQCPQHLNFWTPKHLKPMFGRIGLKIEVVHYESITKDFIRSLGLWLNRKGLMKRESVEDMLYWAWLDGLLYPLFRFASYHGIGDRIHIVARAI